MGKCGASLEEIYLELNQLEDDCIPHFSHTTAKLHSLSMVATRKITAEGKD